MSDEQNTNGEDKLQAAKDLDAHIARDFIANVGPLLADRDAALREQVMKALEGEESGDFVAVSKAVSAIIKIEDQAQALLAQIKVGLAEHAVEVAGSKERLIELTGILLDNMEAEGDGGDNLGNWADFPANDNLL